jgi:hypothetical protein
MKENKEKKIKNWFPKIKKKMKENYNQKIRYT